jgi:hypothetical protein
MAERQTFKLDHLPKKNSGGLNSSLKKMEKKLTHLQLSEDAFFKINPNPKKLLTFNVKF